MLIDMPIGAFPMALGVIYDDPRPTFESAVRRAERGSRRRQARRPPGARLQGPDLAGREGAARDLRLRRPASQPARLPRDPGLRLDDARAIARAIIVARDAAAREASRRRRPRLRHRRRLRRAAVRAAASTAARPDRRRARRGADRRDPARRRASASSAGAATGPVGDRPSAQLARAGPARRLGLGRLVQGLGARRMGEPRSGAAVRPLHAQRRDARRHRPGQGAVAAGQLARPSPARQRPRPGARATSPTITTSATISTPPGSIPA